ncbi:MAG: GEVED domain-containing protein [Flavobacteriales bacterium]|nr:GEVED domain-containing protein [Flavobacteriales bacterium]
MKKRVLGTLTGIVLSWAAMAQVSEGGLPTSFAKISIDETSPYDASYEIISLGTPDMAAIHSEDASKDGRHDNYRVATNIPVSANLTSQGTWLELENGDLLWRLGIRIPGAQALGLYFDEMVNIPAGGKLHAYNEKRSQYVGAYTSETPEFQAMEMIEGEMITLEYLMPEGSTELPTISIESVAYFYRGVEDRIAFFRDGTLEVEASRLHGSCEVDVNCSEGSSWVPQRDAVVHYSFVDGGSTYVCSGSVINNTNNDCTPYILSANHCGEPTVSGDLSGNVWYFNYQRPTCVPGNTAKYTGALSETMSGGIFRASSSWGDYPATFSYQVDGSDFMLVEMTTDIPEDYDAYFAGWSRSTSASGSGVGIHHPAGDEKKISTYSASLYSTTYNSGWSGAHWGVEWISTANGHGVTEGGSSGSPIFNSSGRIVGHLSGGSSYCVSPTDNDLYGKFDRAWDQEGASATERLRNWLDPVGTNPTTLDGTYSPCSPSPPVADFVASATVVSPGTTVDFTDLSSNSPTSWSWSISPGAGWSYTGGTSASDQNPSVNFTTVGFYTVTLTASNGFGSDDETKTSYIEVSESAGPCDATSTSCDEYISNVTMGSIDNDSDCDNYSDYTASESTNVVQGGTETVVVSTLNTGGSAGYVDDQVAVWIDWNQDNDFEDAGEEIGVVTYSADTEIPVTFTVNVPASATVGTTVMRVRMSYEPDDGAIEPCGTSTWGEVEDYAIVVESDGSGPDAPVAQFTADATVVPEGTIVDFSDLSTNSPTSWSWSITPASGWSWSGSSSTDQNPSVLFSTPGTYTVSLTASNAGGSDNETKNAYITVNEAHIGIAENDLQNVEIYPNPTNGQLLINLNKVNTPIEYIEIRDITGRVIMRDQTVNGNVLFDLQKETSGVYFVNVHSSNATVTKKVVKL